MECIIKMLELGAIFDFLFQVLAIVFRSFRRIFGGVYLVLFVLIVAITIFVAFYIGDKNKDDNGKGNRR